MVVALSTLASEMVSKWQQKILIVRISLEFGEELARLGGKNICLEREGREI